MSDLYDLLYGGCGTPDRFTIVWKASETSREALGYEATRDYYKWLPNFEQLHEDGHITTLFDMVVGIFRGHANIQLKLE